MKMLFKKKFSFLLFLNLLLILKASTDYEFKTVSTDDVIEINGFKSIICYETIEVVYLYDLTKSIEIYTFSSENVKEDKYGSFLNYKSYHELRYKDSLNISFSERYLILFGNGYITKKGSVGTLNLNTLLEVKLNPLKSKFYNLKGAGNYMEVLLSNLDVYIDGYQSDYLSFYFDIKSQKPISIVNYNIYSQTAKLLYTYRKSGYYYIDLEKGDTINYMLNQKFAYQVSNSLAQQYYNLEEGIILIGGNFYLSSQQCYFISKVFNRTHKLFYIYPTDKYLNFELETYGDEGKNWQISAKGVNPTIVYNFPSSYDDYKVKKRIAPQYFRINIDKNFNDKYVFNFGTNVEWFEGTMFNANKQLNFGKNISTVSISGEDAGKTYTAIFYRYGTFSPRKFFDSVQLLEYEYKRFALKSGEEKAFIYKGNYHTIVKFENGYNGNKVNIYVYRNLDEVKYNPSTKKYSGFLKELTNWEEITIYSWRVFLIIQANEIYEDYISFRSRNLILNNESPIQFNNLSPYNFIDISLSLKSGENVIEIVSNVNEFDISLFKDKTKEQTCKDNKSCSLLVNNSGNYQYFIYIINKEKEVAIKSPKLYILQYQKKEYYEILNESSGPKYFLLPFEFKFKYTNVDLLSNINLNKEFMINYEGPQSSSGYNIELNYNNETPIKTNEIIQGRDIVHYYYYLKNNNDISDLIITIKGKWDESSGFHYDKFLLRYGGPYLVNMENANLGKEIARGNIIYFKVKNTNSDKKYLFSIPTGAKLIIGDLFKENGELNDNTKETKRYILNNEFFEKSSDVITLEYKGLLRAEIYSELLNGYIIENRKFDDYKTYILNFQNNEIIYYLGIYNNNIDTYAYIDNSDNAISIYYKDGNSTLSSNFSDLEVKKDFFNLNTEYNLIKFVQNDYFTAKLNKEFIIFNPNSFSDDLYYSKQGKFYLKPKNEKKIKLIVDETEKDAYRVVTRSYTETEVELNINSNYEYKLNLTNNYINIFEISKGEDFSYKVSSTKDTLLFSKVLEGKIYERLSINNNTETKLSSNNILFQIYLLENSSYYDIEVSNPKKIKFYYKLYKIEIISDDIEKEKKLRRLTLPILSEDRKASDYQNSYIAKIHYRNPYYELGGRNYEYYFALSYEQDFENPGLIDEYSVNAIYKEKMKHNYTTLDMNTPFLVKNYTEKYFLKQEKNSNLVLTFITYDTYISVANITNENEDVLEVIDLNRKYIQKVVKKDKIDSQIKYEIGFEFKTSQFFRNFCIEFHYNFTNESINEINFEKYNYYSKLEINQNKRKISWNALENVEKYEIYISEETSDLDLFNNLCYLQNLKNKNNSGIKIITTINTFYEFEEKNQNLKVTVVALDSKYKMNFVYNAKLYNYKKDKNYDLVIILSCCGFVFVIGIIVVIIICLISKKKKYDFNLESRISMVDKFNINQQ